MLAYRERFGPFNPVLRFDAAVARAVVRTVGGTMADAMPWPKEIQQEASVDEVFGMFKTMGAANKGKAK